MRNGTSHGAARALPFQPPPPRDHEACLRRWTWRLAGTAAGLLVVSVAVFTFWSNQGTAPAPSSGPPSEKVSPSPGSAAQPVAASTSKEPALSNVKGTDAAQRDRFLEALGSLSAAHLYQSYLNIGLIADGVENETYSRNEGANLLATVQNLLGQVETGLQRVAQTGLDRDDQQALDRVRQVTTHLREQATALLAYWAGGEMDQVSRYRAARALAWDELQSLLGLDD